MIEINLLPEDLRKKESVAFVLPELPIKRTLKILLAAFVGLQIVFGCLAILRRVDAAATSSAIVSLKEQNKEILERKEAIQRLKVRLKDAHVVASRPYQWSRLLNALSDSTTKGVWLRGLSLTDVQSGGGVGKGDTGSAARKRRAAEAAAGAKTEKKRALLLEGTVVAQGQETAYVGKFIKVLKENAYLSTLFESIELQNMNQRKIRETDVFDFSLVCTFRKEKKAAVAE